MTQIPAFSGLAPAAASPSSESNALRELNMDHFLRLMIAELQNQDPLNPLDNSQMLQQISQIREIGATDRLTDTLSTLLVRQNVATATSLIGQIASGTDENGLPALGVVERVSVADGAAQLHLHGETVAEASSEAGGIDAGTYAYKVVFESGGQRYAVDVGPLATTGTAGMDRSVRLRNLPSVEGPKWIYRTDKSRQGDLHFVAEVDGDTSELLDTLGDEQLPDTVLTGTWQPHPGGRRHTISLEKIVEVRAPDAQDEQP